MAKRIPSRAYDALVVIVAALPLVPEIVPGTSLAYPLGRVLYGTAILGIAIVIVFSAYREEARRRREMEERDATDSKRHDELKANHQEHLAAVDKASKETVAVLRAEIRALKVVQQANVPDVSKLVPAIEAAAAQSFANWTQYQQELVRGFEGTSYYHPLPMPSSNTTESLQRLAANPPKTVEAVVNATIELTASATGVVNPPTVTIRDHTDKP